MRARLSPALVPAAAAALAVALAANHAAGRYVSRFGSRWPALGDDLLLNLLPRWDLTSVFVWGFAAFLAFVFGAGLVLERRRAAYILWMYALLVGLRAFFIILTPMGAPPGAFPVQGSALFDAVGRHMTFGNDLFFSAHTSMPFLGFLLFRAGWAKAVFLALSLLLAATVLIARLHYSIDVGAAYFITYALYRVHRRHIEPRAWASWARLAR